MARSDDITRISDDFVHLARLALTGRPQDVQLHVRRLTKRLRPLDPGAADQLVELLREAPTRSSPLRKESASSLPVDLDSRLQLVRVESSVELEVEPIYQDGVCSRLSQLVRERREIERLETHGLVPTRSALFTGAPGVGKTLAAKWLARELEVPLLVLDLAAVMSSFLGRTGNNLRYVLDYAKSVNCVLLLDEFDAIAKRRDDATEVGELKRLVTVLLQEIDDWPADGLLIAATNHSKLLDPAVWRRFELVIDFPMPSDEAVEQAVSLFMGSDIDNAGGWKSILGMALRGSSFSEIERQIMRGRRVAALSAGPEEDHFVGMLKGRLDEMKWEDRVELAAAMVNGGIVTQRRAYELTGISRDTIRKYTRAEGQRK